MSTAVDDLLLEIGYAAMTMKGIAATTERTAESMAGNEGLGLRYFAPDELVGLPIGFDFSSLLMEFCSQFGKEGSI